MLGLPRVSVLVYFCFLREPGLAECDAVRYYCCAYHSSHTVAWTSEKVEKVGFTEVKS